MHRQLVKIGPGILPILALMGLPRHPREVKFPPPAPSCLRARRRHCRKFGAKLLVASFLNLILAGLWGCVSEFSRPILRIFWFARRDQFYKNYLLFIL